MKNIDKSSDPFAVENLLEFYFENKQDDLLREHWNEKLTNEYSETTQVIPFKRDRILLMAASVVILIGSICVLSFINSSSNFTADLYVAELAPISNYQYDHRGVAQEEASFSGKAYNCMKEENYSKAISIYTIAHEAGELDEYDSYHLALSYTKTNYHYKSIEILEEKRNEQIAFQQEIYWLLAINYVKTNQHKKAKNILKLIIDGNLYRYQQAKELQKSF